MILFVDASFLIALFHIKDDFHSRAKLIVKQIERESSLSLLTSNIVIAEVVNYIFRRKGAILAKKFLKAFKKGRIREVFITPETYTKAYKLLFRQKSKKGLNLFDCFHLAVMKELGVKKILTFDKDFKKEAEVIGC